MTNDSRTCFFPSGAVASNNVPCSSDEYTSCCGLSDLCLSNGLCLSVTHQPYVLSRGACTDPEWGSGCPQYCRDNNPEGGCSIVNINYYLGVSTYCCGTLIANNESTVICPNNGSAFEVPTGHAMIGYAMLANISSLDAATNSTNSSTSSSNWSNCSSTDNTTATPASTTCTSASCHSTAVGVGLGVSLGVIALASLAWAYFERRRAKAQAAAALPSSSIQPAWSHSQPPVTYVQVGGGIAASELDGTQQSSELDTRK
ncbi:hypothetical protein BJX64DRAFT_301614 [Aspergillus heterothallicus]